MQKIMADIHVRKNVVIHHLTRAMVNTIDHQIHPVVEINVDTIATNPNHIHRVPVAVSVRKNFV
jgi:hypothetical protein